MLRLAESISFQAGHTIPAIFWKICPYVERPLVWSQEYRQRPAACSYRNLANFLIYIIYIWSFFSIYFYINKIFIHYFGNLFVFKGFMSHHMAPVACTISYTKKYRLIFFLCSLKSIFSPCVPVNRIISVL